MYIYLSIIRIRCWGGKNVKIYIVRCFKNECVNLSYFNIRYMYMYLMFE